MEEDRKVRRRNRRNADGEGNGMQGEHADS